VAGGILRLKALRRGSNPALGLPELRRRQRQENSQFHLSVVSPNPSIDPPWSQTAGPAQSPPPFYIVEPHHSRSSCSIGDDNRTPCEPAMPVHV
jgi:hypothetical protein